MKCKRCGAEMRRQKLKEHQYRYVCSRCGLVIGKHDSVANASAEETETHESESKG